jgi:hypothetical protein
VVATLLAAPLAFVAGTFRPRHKYDHAYTWRGLAAAAFFVIAATLLPAGRLFAYDPNTTPGAPLARGGASTDLTISQLTDGSFSYLLAGSNTVETVDVWPASTEGVSIVVDPSATQPALSGVSKVDLTRLPARGQWWVSAVVPGSDERRMTLAVVIQTGPSPDLTNALAWLISRL